MKYATPADFAALGIDPGPLKEGDLERATEWAERSLAEEHTTPRPVIVSRETYAKAERLGLVRTTVPASMPPIARREPWALIEDDKPAPDRPSARDMMRVWWAKKQAEVDAERLKQWWTEDLSHYGVPVDVMRPRRSGQPSGNARDRRRARRAMRARR